MPCAKQRKSGQAEGYALKTRALANAVMQRGRDKNWDVLADPSRLHISTIDSFALCYTSDAQSLPAWRQSAGS